MRAYVCKKTDIAYCNEMCRLKFPATVKCKMCPVSNEACFIQPISRSERGGGPDSPGLRVSGRC